MHSLILILWKERRMGMIWQDLGGLTTVQAREFCRYSAAVVVFFLVPTQCTIYL